MASVYFNETLIAKSGIPGILSSQLINEEIIITYDHSIKKYYTVIMYDDQEIHSLLINVKGEDLDSGDVLVEYQPFISKASNYGAVIYIYEQMSKIPLPDDDFDMEKFIIKYKLKLLYHVEFFILQKVIQKPNVYSSRYFRTKLRNYIK